MEIRYPGMTPLIKFAQETSCCSIIGHRRVYDRIAQNRKTSFRAATLESIPRRRGKRIKRIHSSFSVPILLSLINREVSN